MSTSLQQSFVLNKSPFESKYFWFSSLRCHQIPFPPWFGVAGLLEHFPNSSFSDFSKQEIEDFCHGSTKVNSKIKGVTALFLAQFLPKTSSPWSPHQISWLKLLVPLAAQTSLPAFHPLREEKLQDQREGRCCSFPERSRAHWAGITVWHNYWLCDPQLIEHC